MCPSFMLTREEACTTRGRSRALFEMLHDPGPIERSWRSEAVREATDQAFIVADGFNCREQIRHGAGREPLHLAQVLHRALRDGG